MEKARRKAQHDVEVRKIRDEQIRQRQEIAARSVERDRQHWDEVKQMWQESVELDRQQQDQKAKVSCLLRLKLQDFGRLFAFLDPARLPRFAPEPDGQQGQGEGEC